MIPHKTLLLDLSPVWYRWVFASTGVFSRKGKKQENGLYDLAEYKDILIYQVVNYIASQKERFGVDEIVIAVDSKPYWRKKYWTGYKYGRKSTDGTPDSNGIDWAASGAVQDEVLTALEQFSSYNVVRIPGVEGDDIIFVLAPMLSKQGTEVIVHSVDHDLIYTMEHPNVKYWQTKYASKTKSCGFVHHNDEEIKQLKYEHCVFGDGGDNIKSIVAYTQFSEEFKEQYPSKTELQVYEKRHEIDVMFRDRNDGISAYKHPRFGAKSFAKKQKKEGFTLEEFLDENPIHQMNYDLNTLISMPESIPTEIVAAIEENYKNNPPRNVGELSNFFMKYGIMSLVGRTGIM